MISTFALRERFRFSIPTTRDLIRDPSHQNPRPRPLPPLLERREPIEYANALSSKHRSKGNLRSERHAAALAYSMAISDSPRRMHSSHALRCSSSE